MRRKIIFGALILLLIAGLINSCISAKVKRTTLFQGSKPYPWKVEYVQKSNFPAGKYHHYEVFYGDEQLLIPKEIFGSEAAISEFVAANGFEIQHNRNFSVLLTIENISKQNSDFTEHRFISFFVSKINDGKEKKTFVIRDLNDQVIGKFEH